VEEDKSWPRAILALCAAFASFVMFIVFVLWSLNPHTNYALQSILALIFSMVFIVLGAILIPKPPPPPPLPSNEFGQAHNASAEEIEKWTKLMK